ncbi:glutathione/cysteine ABC transporter permease/ATP-binding protein [Actinokineospora bangkokensis]|uniref:Glutathione/cysteine ABC transporter permease/ATP-binding protein n=1 Tax=Actinokineospora bangkokensis TaxID=1193682 RepID=A0A1Q9LM71_9PSEU|nr:thiol reductant ABC exporter subunit CydD [Actinokineospora bangkokensis]OLR93137.1 glutathione/cysteine ABC transporter permease/ATP-binding protein [Actinokineospora bangkokensis]
MSPSARRALQGCGALSVLAAVAVVAQAWALAAGVAGVVGGRGLAGWCLPVLAGAVVARSALAWASAVVAARAAAGAKAELRALLVDRALALGPEWVAARGAGELTALATRGLDALDDYFAVYLPALVTAVAAPLGVGAVLLAVDWPSALVVALTVPLIPLFAVVIGRYTEDRVGPAAAAVERLSGYVLELVRALPVLAAFRRARAQGEVVRAVSEAHRTRTLGVLRVAFASAFALELIATLSVALVAVVIGLRLVAGDLPLAVGLFVLVVVPECYLPLRAAGAAHHASEDGLEAVRRVAAIPAAPAGGDRVVRSFTELRVTDLRVRRRGGFAPDGACLVVRPGEVVRLDSPSGSGKSTLLAVLLGFARPESGSVAVDGVPLSTVDMSTWRDVVGWVPQRPVFAEDRVAVPRRWAAEVGVAHLVGRRVAELSTGERQRVAVARALARPGLRLLLLDEPTAHLDAAAAAQVMTAVERAAARGAAVVLATHGVRAEAGPADTAVTAVAHTPRDRPRARLRTLVTGRLVWGALLGAAALTCGVALTALSGWLIARASQQPPILTLSLAVVGVRFFGLARACLRYLERLATHDAAFRTATTLRTRLWADLVRRGPAHALALRRGQALQDLVTDVDTTRDLTPRVLTPPLVALLVAAAAITVQTLVLPGAGAALAAAVLVAGFAAPWLTVHTERNATTTLAATRQSLATTTLTLFEAAPDLLARNETPAYRAQLSALDEKLTRTARRQALSAGLGTALITLALGLATTAAIALAAAQPALNPVLVPILALIPLALAEALTPLTTAATHLPALRAALPAPVDAHPHNQTTSTTMENGGTPGAVDNGLTDRGDCGSGVLLEDVTARWPGAQEAALRDVDLRVAPGERVTVVGPSGAGKSTLGAVLLGFLEPERGRARLVRTAWSPQEPMLVSTSVRENLKLADPHLPDAALRRALDDLGLAHLPLDATATTLSGGEAQRVGLARALLADADLLLADEPTAHLDATSAARVERALDRYPGSVVHISHQRRAGRVVRVLGRTARLDPAPPVRTA